MSDRGLCVALLGPDGAGKTTIGRGLAAELSRPVHYVYSGLSPAEERFRALRRLPWGGRILRTARVVGVGMRARRHRRLGHVVVLDRTPHEFRADEQHRGFGLWLRTRALGLLMPEPDLVVLLDAPGEVLFARKGEHSPEALDRMRAGYHRLLPSFRSSEVVDVRAPEVAVRKGVAELIERRLGAPVQKMDDATS